MLSRYINYFLAMITIIALVCSVLPASAEQKGSTADKVASVNGKAISQEDFDREMSRIGQRIAGKGQPVSDARLKAIKKEVLENLIGVELLYQESQNKGVKIEETDVNMQWDNIKKRYPSGDELKKALTKMKLSEKAVKSQIRRGLAIKKLLDTQVLDKIKATDKEIKEYYDSHPDAFKRPEVVRASHILITLDPKADKKKKTEARKKIENIQGKVKKGEDFAKLAKEFSQGPSGAKGGDLNYFPRGKMIKSFEDVAFALKIGEVSDIVETRFGFHLIKVVDKKKASTVGFEETKDKLRNYLKQQKSQKATEKYALNLKKNAKVERYLAY